MESMAKNRVALLECEGLKLALQPDSRPGPVAAAASSIAPSQVAQMVPYPPGAEDPVKAMHAAREAASRLAEQRLALSQQQTASSRRRAAKGGIGPRDPSSLVKDVFESSKKVRPSNKPA